MARYIDADALKLDIDMSQGARITDLALSVIRTVQNAPTADVAPRAEVAREIFAELESKIKNDMDDIAESINSITDPDAIDGQYEEIATLEWVLDYIAELKEKYTDATDTNVGHKTGE